jgi:hypothetical protein
MAAAAPRHPDNASSAARGIYRFLGNSHFVWGDLLKPLYRKAKSLFAQEKQVLGIIDLSPVEKPYARKMKGLCRVRRNDGSGTTNGYMSISTILHWAGKTGLGYFKLFSHQCELMSQNQEIDLATSGVRRLLSGRTKIIWVWDRGFDDKKNYRKVLSWKDKFVGRVYQNRQVRIGGEDCGLSLWLLRAQILWVEGIDVNTLKDRDWWLVTNIRISNDKIAKKIWRYYRARWQIETFFKFLKKGLGMEEFQVTELERIRRIVSLVVIAGMFIYKLGITLDDEPIKILLYLGGWTGRDKPGKFILKRGVAIFLAYLYVDSFLKTHEFS